MQALAVAFPVLIGDADWIRALIPLVLLVIWVISQVMGAKGNAQPGRKAAPKPPRPPGQPAQPAGNIANEIEEFLKKAAQRKEGQRPQAAQQTAPAPKPSRKQTEKHRRETVARTPAISGRRESISSTAPLSPTESARRPIDVATSVAQHLDTKEFAERASHLTTVDQADEQMSAHLSRVFDHAVGTLASSTDPKNTADPAAEQTPASSRAGALAGLLANRNNLRSVIVLNEIMQRPEHRW